MMYCVVWVPGGCVGILRGLNRGPVHRLVDEQLWRLQRIVERGRVAGLHRLGCFATHLTIRDFIPPSQDWEHSLQFPTVHSEPHGTSRLQGTAGLGLSSCLQSPGCRTRSSPATVRTHRMVRFFTPVEPHVDEHVCHPPTHHLAGQSLLLHLRCLSSGRLLGSHRFSSTTPTSCSKQRTG